jgi:hypothetical protein
MSLFNAYLIATPLLLVFFSKRAQVVPDWSVKEIPERPEFMGRSVSIPFFLLVWILLIVRHQVQDPHWIPHGPDWDRWYQSALAVGSEIPYPPHRWPLWAWIANAFDSVSPRPFYVNVQIVTLGGTAALLTGVFRMSWRLLGYVGAVVATLLAALSPMVLQTADWASAYSAWAALVIWCIVAMMEFTRTGGKFWAVTCGATWGGILAIMPKGLGIGLLLLPVLGLAILIRLNDGAKSLGRHFALFSLPVLILGFSYANFPTPLMTLDARVSSADVVEPESVEADLHQEIVIHENYSPDTYTEDGYVFGQQTSITTIFNTLRVAGESTSSQDRMRIDSWARFTGALPTVDMWLITLLSAGLAIITAYSLKARAWHEVIGWAGILVVVIGVGVTILRPLFQLRFLTPAAPLIAVLAVAPTAHFARRTGSKIWRAVPLTLIPVALLGASPWNDNDTVDAWVEAVDVRGDTAIQVIDSIGRLNDIGPIDAMAPANIAVPVLGEFGGRFLTPDPRFYPMTKPIYLDPNSNVLFVRDPLLLERLEGADPFGPDEVTNFYGRDELGSWAAEGGMTVVLLGKMQ